MSTADDGVALYGRGPEREVIGRLLDAARSSRSGALVLRGEAGIGKTALLKDTRRRAEGMQVLFARGIESESELPFAALHQLIRPALGHLEQVPPHQATALRAALGLAEGTGQDRFLVFAACLSLLSELAEIGPVLCLVDDAHWLDAASADALRFVAHRLDAEGILILFAAREGEVHSFEAADLSSLELSGLDAEAAGALLARGAAVHAAPAVREHLVARTRGNALALVELPSALTPEQLAGHEPLPEALERLDSLLEAGSGALDPIVGPLFPDKIEAALRASRPDEARAALERFESWLGYSGAPAAQPRLAACRALLAADGDATRQFEAAVEQSETARPFDLARIRLLYGEQLRRERNRAGARLQLRAALEAFERLRAEPWAERARAELRATGETARKRDPSTIGQLTPQELQIVRYVAEGLSNKEVAARLFLSPRTIEYHLRHVFSKLSITSRLQLAHAVLGGEEPVAELSAALA